MMTFELTESNRKQLKDNNEIACTQCFICNVSWKSCSIAATSFIIDQKQISDSVFIKGIDNIFTAHKLSLGQGNVLHLSVSHSVHGGVL